MESTDAALGAGGEGLLTGEAPRKTVVSIAIDLGALIKVADLLVRGVDDAVVQALKARAGAHSRSAEAEHRAILAATLLAPHRRNLAKLLAAMPDVGSDTDFARSQQSADNSCVFD